MNLTIFDIVDRLTITVQPETETGSPEAASEGHFWMRLFQSGKCAILGCRVYWHS